MTEPLRITVPPAGTIPPPSEEGASGDPWAKYRTPPKGVAAQAPPDPWAKYREPPSTAGDVAKSLAIGVPKGLIGILGMPKDIPDLIETGINWGNKKLVDMGFPGAEPRDQTKLFENKMPGSHDIRKAVESQTGEFYEPRTRAGKYAQNVGEFVPNVLTGPGGIVRKLATQAVVPGIASEAAGHAVEGTKAEPWVRAGVGLVTGVGASKLAGPGGAQNALRSHLPEWVTDAHIGQAEGLISDGAARGINLTWSEALSQVTGRPVLTDMQRIVESAPHTRSRMQDHFGERPQQVEGSVRRELDQIAPGTANPSTIGHAVGDTAENTLTDVRGAINKATEPFYKAAESQILTPAQYAQFRALPGYREAHKAVRGDPQLNRYVRHLPNNSVGFLNEVKKYLDQAAENATHPMTAQRNAQRGAGYTKDAADARQIGINASPDYQVALNAQQQARQQFLEPLLQGPLGRVAGKDTTTQKAIEVLFPKQPIAGSAAEISTAVRAVAQRNPWAATELVRAHLESELHKAFNAAGRGQEAAQFAGARFALNTAGSPNAVSQQFENIHAALSALPNGQVRAAGFARLLPILQATGTRTGKGSLTSFNTRELERMATGGSVQNVVKHVTSPGEWWHLGEHAISRWQLGRNLDQLATVLTSPQSGQYLRVIARMPHNSPRTLTLIGKMLAASTTDQRAKKPEDRK